MCLQFKADLTTFCNRNHYLLPPYSQARFPQTWPRSKLASSYEPSVIGGRDVASLMHFTFFATCLSVTWRFRKLRISTEFVTSKGATRFRANSFLRTSDPELIAAKNQYERVNIYSRRRIQLNFKRANFHGRHRCVDPFKDIASIVSDYFRSYNVSLPVYPLEKLEKSARERKHNRVARTGD